MLLLESRLHFYSELTSCGHWWLAEVNEMLREIVFPRSFVDVFLWLKHWVITWGIRCSVMFVCVKTSSTEEGMIAFTRAPLCTSLQRIMAQTREQELIAAALVMLVLGLCQHVSEPSRSGSPRRLYSDLSCHIKDCQNAIYYLNFLKKINKKILYPFGTHASRTERPIPKRFGTNMFTVTPLIYIYVCVCVCVCVLPYNNNWSIN